MNKRFLTHEEKVLINDTILEKREDWSKIIPILIETSSFPSSINSFGDFEKGLGGSYDSFCYICSGYSYTNLDSYLKGTCFEPLIPAICVLKGNFSLQDALKVSLNPFIKLLVVVSYLAKLKNDKHGHHNFVYINYLKYYNAYKDCELDIPKSDYIVLRNLFTDLGEIYKQTWRVLSSNILKRNHRYSKQFIKGVRKAIKTKPQFYHGEDWNVSPTTFEEFEIYMMSKISVNDSGELVPFVVYRNGDSYPNTDKWESAYLDNLMKFFDNDEYIAFVVESIDYLVSQNQPNNDTCLKYIHLIRKWCCREEWFEGRSVLSIYCKLSKEKKINKTIRKEFERLVTPKLSSKLIKYPLLHKLYYSEVYLPIKIVNKIKNHGNYLYLENIKKADSEYALREIISNEEIIDSLTKMRFFRIRNIFYSLTPKIDNGVAVSDLYIAFGKLLCHPALNKLSINLEKEKIRLIEHWQKMGFENSQKGMQSFTSKPFEMTTNEVEKFSKLIEDDPRNFGFSLFSHSDNDFWSIVERGSNNPFNKFVDVIKITKIFPKKDTIDVKQGFQSIIAKQIDLVKSGKEYKLLNSFESERYLTDYFEQINMIYDINLTLFHSCKNLYCDIRDKYSNLSLLVWEDKPSYAFVCQLFPALEDEIIKNGIKNNISPLSEKEGIFAKRKEPATVLIRRFKKSLNDYKSLEPVSDLIAVYLMMYDSKSMNVRNNMVHGNEYPLDLDILERYRKAAIISLGIIIKRNETE